MRTWTRAVVPDLCGHCRRVMAIGEPTLVYDLVGLSSARRRKVRCQVCAGEPVPLALPPLPVRQPVKAMYAVASGPSPLAIDWKSRAFSREDT